MFEEPVKHTYSRADDLLRLNELVGTFNTVLASGMEDMFIELRSIRDYVSEGNELTSAHRTIVGSIGDFLYNDLYSDIGRNFSAFGQIQHQDIMWP